MRRTDPTQPEGDGAGWLAVEAERLAVGGRFRESERLLGRLLSLQEQAVAGHRLDVAETLGMRGEVRFLAGDLAGAEEDFRRALAIREGCLGLRHPDVAGSLSSLALVLWRRGEAAAAEPFLSRCWDIRRGLLGNDHVETRGTEARLKRLWRELSGREEDVAATAEDECEAWGETSGSAVVAEWTALRDRFGELSRRLLDAAKADQEAPYERLVHELAECRSGFGRLCDEARAWAEAFRVPCPPDGQLENLLGIGAFLDQVGEAVLNHERHDRPRRRALLVLHQVLRLAHVTDRDFAPLAACQDSARALFWRFEAGLGADTAELRPFYDLLVLSHQRHTLSDDAWLHAYQSVSLSFGKALAAAATRGNLVPSLAVLDPGAGEPAATATAAFLNPAFARPEDEYEVALQAFELLPTPAGPAVIGGPLSVASDELGARRVAPTHLVASLVRFRTADGKLYTLMPAEPIAKEGPRSTALRERTPVAR